MSSKDSKPLFHPMLKWLRYSGATVAVTVNPWHWSWWPRTSAEPEDIFWSGPNHRNVKITVQFLTLRIWIDDGSW